MKRIMALDLATTTGHAQNEPALSGSKCFRESSRDSVGAIYIRFRVWINTMLTMYSPELVIYEKTFSKSIAATELLLGLRALVHEACETHGVKYTSCAATTLKKHATGKGKATKEDMISACIEKLKITPGDDNEADALWLLDYGKKKFGG